MFQLMHTCVRISRVHVNINCHNLKEFKRNAGHSKWANIKHTKGIKDAQKSTTFHKMSRLMRLAIEEGGSSDPNSNLQLSNIIEQAKRHNMPIVSIQNIIKQSQNKDKKINAKSCNFEIRGPGGCIIVVCVTTDNLPKARSSLNSIVKKNNASFTEGSIGGLFDHKGVIDVNPPENTTLETAVEHAIEIGAEEVTELEPKEDNTLQFLCEPILLNQVKGKLEKLKYDIKSAECEFIPNMQVSLSDADLQAVKKLYDKLEDYPDVVRLFDNIE